MGVKSPALFTNRNIGKTLVNRTQGTKIASEGLKGRVFEVSLADLQNENDAERSYRKFKLICEDVQAKNCLTSFYGMNLTPDKLRSMVKKVKVMRRPRFDLTKLMDMHGEGGSGKTVTVTNPETGEVVERAEGYEPPTQESV